MDKNGFIKAILNEIMNIVYPYMNPELQVDNFAYLNIVSF